MTDGWTLLAIVGLAGVTVVSRSFFFISSRPWPLPAWAERGLQYAPIAALAAVIAPEIVTVQGEFMPTWKDARLFGALAGLAIYAWRGSVLWTLVAGMAVYLPLRLALGW